MTFIEHICEMQLKKIIRMMRWFAYDPFRRCKYLFSSNYREIAAGSHWSTDLDVKGALQFGASIILGRRSRVTVPASASLHLKDGVWIGDDCELSTQGEISIGFSTSLQNRSIILGDVTIGSGCACGPNLYISSAWHHFADDAALPIRWQDARAISSASKSNLSRQVLIGDDCWFGINVVVAPGVTVGRGCIIGANSVVTKNLAPYSVVAGSPAKLIRKRLDFLPPRSLQANLSQHIPYFYSGFQQWGGDIQNMRAAPSVTGWQADKCFSVALQADAGAVIDMEVRVALPGLLRHGAQNFRVPLGHSIVRLVAVPDKNAMLVFNWFPDQPIMKPTICIIALDQNNEK